MARAQGKVGQKMGRRSAALALALAEFFFEMRSMGVAGARGPCVDKSIGRMHNGVVCQMKGASPMPWSEIEAMLAERPAALVEIEVSFHGGRGSTPIGACALFDWRGLASWEGFDEALGSGWVPAALAKWDAAMRGRRGCREPIFDRQAVELRGRARGWIEQAMAEFGQPLLGPWPAAPRVEMPMRTDASARLRLEADRMAGQALAALQARELARVGHAGKRNGGISL